MTSQACVVVSLGAGCRSRQQNQDKKKDRVGYDSGPQTRIDFLVEGTDWYVNEINTIPGSLAKHLWVDVPFADLLSAMLDEARARPTTATWTTDGADGSALRAADSIATKLG